jgi:hypothetical protein
MHRIGRLLSLGIVLGAQLPERAFAQEYVGPTKCTGCHVSLAAPSWKKYHAGSLAQVDQGKGPQWTQKSVGGNTKDPRCLRCHAPVALASGPSSVSCESCHGPAKGYLIPHRQDAFYQAPDRKGLRDLFNNAGAVANVCVACHVLGAEDKDIAAAGHPTGANFETGSKLMLMVHWPSDEAEGVSAGPRKRAYAAAFYGSVAAQAKPLLQTRLQALGNLPAAPPLAGPPPAAPKAGPATQAPLATPPKAAAAPPKADDEFRDLKPGELIKVLPDAPTGAYPPPPVPRALQPQNAAPPPAMAAPAPGPSPIETQGAPPAPALTSAPVRGASNPRVEAAQALTRLLQNKKRLDLPPPKQASEMAGDERFSVEDAILALALETLGRRNP